jgi:hypothetical protein
MAQSLNDSIQAMNDIFKKLNYKDQEAIYVINAPASFNSAVDEMRPIAAVHDTLSKAKAVTFAIAFATQQTEVDKFAQQVAKASEGDAVIWIAYPKGSSKKYKCEFNRDTGWAEMGKQGFEPVRQVAIDEDWSALRFRRADFIKSMTRSFAMSEKGQQKVKQRKG